MFRKIKSWFLTIFGDIKYYKYPMFIVYCPTTYKVKGEHYLELVDKILPGDLILRGYDDYLDGVFIPGNYSHSGIYVGNNTVIHAVAEGVSEINLIDFMRTDRIMVLRPREGATEAIERADFILSESAEYDFDFLDNNERYYCHELSANCYKKYNIKKIKVKRFLGLYNKELYLAESLINNSNFKIIYEYNPKEHKYINIK